MTNPELLQITKKDLTAAINNMTGEYSVVALTKKGDKILFDKISNSDEIEFDYKSTVLSPKKFFFPVKEVFLEYSAEGKVSPKIEAEKLVLFGIRPCDVNAFKILDEAFSDSAGDPNYLAKKERSVVIGLDCKTICDENAFCYTVNAHNATKGCDVMLHEIDDIFLISIYTQKGKDLIQRYMKTTKGDPMLMNKFNNQKASVFGREKTFKNLDKLPQIFDKNMDHPIWDEEGGRCLSCGSCIMCCPTCYCFDVADELALNLKKGERIRRWDACMINSFAVVAGGENFRNEVEDRLRHRIGRKFNYLMKKHGQPVCVGCGRCVRGCLAGVSPKKIVEEILAHEEKLEKRGRKKKDSKDTLTEIDRIDSLYVPEKAKITKIISFTDKEKLFEVEMNRPWQHDPGQFVQVSVLGIGEAPISVASAPSKGKKYELCIRAVGEVTNKLHQFKVGEEIHVRGPFGHGFDKKILKRLKGKHLVLIAGGLGYAPMRSLINKVLDEKDKYENISILYGCKTPNDRLFKEELSKISKIGGNVELLEIVDKGEDGWHGHEGVITELIPKVEFNNENTIAVVIGPPIMYRFVLETLMARGLPSKNIYVSLERRMKCGVGKCGHCQMGGIYICKEGPVFNYADVEKKEEVL